MRLSSSVIYTQHYFPPFKVHDENKTSFLSFARSNASSNFGKFTALVTLITFGQWIAGPFFSVYMLTVLDFNYTTFIFINMFSSIVSLFVFPLFGKLSDKRGNVFLLRFGAIIIPVLPVLWFLLQDPLWIMFGPQLLGGIGWTAFNLAIANFIYESVPSEKRASHVAYFNLFVGLGVITGGLAGSILVTLVPLAPMDVYHLVFLLSGIVRGVFVVIFLPKVKEVRITANPVLNVKYGGVYRWLQDILLREKKKNGNGKSGNGKGKKSPPDQP